MKTTVVIPDTIFRRIKATAALEGRSLRAFLLEAVMHELEQRTKTSTPRQKKVQPPLVRSKRPGSLRITGDTIADILTAEDVHALARH